MSRLVDKDMGWKKHGRMLKKQAMSTPNVRVGIIGPDANDAHADSDLTIIEIASFHEFGRGHNPERSFIRGNHDAHEQDYARDIRLLADQVLTGKLSHERALRLFGEKVVADIKAFMREGIPPEKKDGTPARLKRTGQLYGSLTAQVKM